MKFILILMFSIGTLQASDWTGFKGCGLYRADGVVRLKDHALVIVLNEKTKSEIIISVPLKNEPMLAPHLDRPMSTKVNLVKPMNGSLGSGEIVEIESRLPHPLNPQDTGLRFIKLGECKK